MPRPSPYKERPERLASIDLLGVCGRGPPPFETQGRPFLCQDKQKADPTTARRDFSLRFAPFEMTVLGAVPGCEGALRATDTGLPQRFFKAGRKHPHHRLGRGSELEEA